MITYQPVIIIGAPRSGTNMLRDVLTCLSGCATWPCDEINYIWRHGNLSYPTDEFPPALARPEVASYIREQFEKIARKSGSPFIIEKTCANSLRVEFVDAILRDARYVFICRDGIDVVNSAMKRWTAPLDIHYVLAKARFVPITDFPYYFLRYLWNHLYRIYSKENRLSFWGPKIQNMNELLQRYSLAEICALQWQRCVELSWMAFEKMPVEKFIHVRYEDFVCNSRDELARICDFIGVQASSKEITVAVKDVSATSVAKGRTAFGKQEIDRLESLLGPTLMHYGYM